MDKYYILDNNNNVVEATQEEHLKFPSERNIVSFTEIGGIRISTIFMGNNYGGDTPYLFETMLFEGLENYDHLANRYSTYQEALEGHKIIVDKVKLKNHQEACDNLNFLNSEEGSFISETLSTNMDDNLIRETLINKFEYTEQEANTKLFCIKSVKNIKK